MAKSYNMTFQEVLHDISYTNMILYSAVIPGYDDQQESEDTFDTSKDANDPANFSDEPDEKIIRR